MNDTSNIEQNSSDDIIKYLSILWNRKFLILFSLIISVSAMSLFLYKSHTIWRIDAKLMVTKSSVGIPNYDILQQEKDKFFATQIEIINGPNLLKMIQNIMQVSPAQFDKNIKKIGRAHV